jgi:hypothetical protein
MLIFEKCNSTELLLFLMFLFSVTGYFLGWKTNKRSWSVSRMLCAIFYNRLFACADDELLGNVPEMSRQVILEACETLAT